MSETKFTPGPWKNYAPVIGGTVEDCYRTIAAGLEYLPRKTEGQGFAITGYISEEDANLIASAPDLYAENIALRAALQNLIDEQNGPPLETRRAQWEAAMNEAKDILSK